MTTPSAALAVSVIKVGGAVVESEESLQAFLALFTALPGAKVLVHGGGRSATALAQQLGIETRMVGGRRITDSDTLRIVTMVYGGLVNKHIVASMQALGTDALGLTGADLALIRAHRRSPVPQKDGNSIDYGYVGDIDSCDGERLKQLIALGITPVIAPLTLSGETLLNTNADTVAAETAKALAAAGCATTLVYCFEHAGVLADPADEATLIPHINAQSFPRLVADGTVSGGMIPKIENALAACQAGVSSVRIASASNLQGGTSIALD